MGYADTAFQLIVSQKFAGGLLQPVWSSSEASPVPQYLSQSGLLSEMVSCLKQGIPLVTEFQSVVSMVRLPWSPQSISYFAKACTTAARRRSQRF